MSSGSSNFDPSMQPPMMPNIPSQPNPSPIPSSASTPPTTSTPTSSQSSSGGFESFKTFLGPQGYAQFMNILCMMITNQLGKETNQIKQASLKLRDSLTGNDD